MDGKRYTILNISKKKAGMAMLISTKVDFISNTINRDKEDYFIIIKVSVN